MLPRDLVRVARQRAGLSQRALARRAGTAQSVVARIETGDVSPAWDTLTRLVEASGFTLEATLAIGPAGRTHMLDDVPRILRLGPEQRLQEVANFTRFLGSARRA